MKLVFKGRCDYVATYEAMRAFTQTRGSATPSELWLCEHPPVFTLGLAGKPEHVLDAHGVPVVPTNRGGQVTYHGPGQVVAYPLVDLRHCDAGRGIFVKEYVYRLEQAVIQTLAAYGVAGQRVPGAPGIYVRVAPRAAELPAAAPAPAAGAARASAPVFTGLAKVAALGIKVSQHCAYHGVALNVAMDLQPFSWINPCGYAGLRTVDLATLGVHADWQAVAEKLAERLQAHLS
ncbi:MAG: lipoyl(octanoyl) transferase LipB [Betaproteobacteria bacterium]|nr:lipoyl(octanoyl) transferase LipB [Betaproteobacteria bacterium]